MSEEQNDFVLQFNHLYLNQPVHWETNNIKYERKLE